MLTLAKLAARLGRKPGAPEEVASTKIEFGKGDAARPIPDGGVAGALGARDEPPGVNPGGGSARREGEDTCHHENLAFA
jgi:hypothetical protein